MSCQLKLNDGMDVFEPTHYKCAGTGLRAFFVLEIKGEKTTPYRQLWHPITSQLLVCLRLVLFGLKWNKQI